MEICSLDIPQTDARFFVCIGEGNGMDKKDYIGTDVLRRAVLK